MKQYGADAEAMNNLPPVPRAPGASAIPYKPIKARGPSSLALMGNIGSSIMGGVSAGVGFKNMQLNQDIKAGIGLPWHNIKKEAGVV